MLAEKEYSIAFTLLNSATSQSSPEIVLSTPTMGTLITTKGSGNEAPLLIAGFTMQTMGQLITRTSTVNTLTVTLSTNVWLGAGSVIHVHNLVNAKTEAGVFGNLTVPQHRGLATHGSSLAQEYFLRLFNSEMAFRYNLT